MEVQKCMLAVLLITASVTLVLINQGFQFGEKFTPLSDLNGSSFTVTGEYWLNPSGKFPERVVKFNRALVAVRKLLMSGSNHTEWRNINQSGFTVVWGNQGDFFQNLSSHPNVHTLFLTWRHDQVGGKDDRSVLKPGTLSPNFLVTNYYRWVVSDPLCQWISSKGGTHMHYDVVHNRNCTTNTFLAQVPIPLEHRAFNAKPVNKFHYWPNNGTSYPSWFYTQYPKFVFYIHIVQDAVVTANGDFITGNLKYVPYSCGVDLRKSAPGGYKTAPLHEEVFVIYHRWGGGYFHGTLEDLPRMVPYLDFLEKNPHIKIHAAGVSSRNEGLLSILNITKNRVVGGVVRAKWLYMPRPTPCGFPLVQETQMFSKILNRYTERNLKATERNKIVLIRRSGSRHFSDQQNIENMTKELAKEYGLEFFMWIDNPVPPLEVGLRMFHGALMVVAPHGAGLSNTVFCQPGTYVIEGVCNRPHVNLCFQHTAHILGHRYHGIPSRGGCLGRVTLTAADLKPILKTYLNQIKSV